MYERVASAGPLVLRAWQAAATTASAAVAVQQQLLLLLT
jgi:hypothetical protein